MKILQICNKVPFPPLDGGCIAMNNLTEGLINQGCQVKVLAINTKKHFVDIDTLSKEYRDKTSIETVFVDTEISIADAVSNLFSSKSYNIERFYSEAFSDKLIEILKKESFDIIQLESLYVSMYINTIRKHSKAKIVLRSHNIEHKLWEYNAQLAKNPSKKVYFKLLAKRLKDFELGVLKTVDSILTITKNDEAFFKQSGYDKPILTVPFGVDIEKYVINKKKNTNKNTVFHIGAMDWQHNIEGVNWFLKLIWKKVLLKKDDAVLLLAGRNMSARFKIIRLDKVTVVGEVDSAIDFIQSNNIMIVPLLSGAGMRVKIIEGMALGKTIITTSFGAEGVEYENNKNIIIANTPSEFANAIIKCLNDSTFAENVGVNARQLIEEKYNNTVICKNLVAFYISIL